MRKINISLLHSRQKIFGIHFCVYIFIVLYRQNIIPLNVYRTRRKINDLALSQTKYTYLLIFAAAKNIKSNQDFLFNLIFSKKRSIFCLTQFLVRNIWLEKYYRFWLYISLLPDFFSRKKSGKSSDHIHWRKSSL